MTYSMYLCLALATVATRPATEAPDSDLDGALRPALDALRQLVERFHAAPVTPAAALDFENALQQQVRELGRLVVQWAFNHLEPDGPEALPAQVGFEGDAFRRLGRKTPQELSTLFGPAVVRRWGYRAAPAVGAPVLFPLCQALGLVQGVTPAAAERAARYLAEAGATQRQVLTRLRREHGLRWGVPRLRRVAAAVAAALEEQRPGAQAGQLLAWLAQAQASRGPHRPVLGVGRDGITLGLRIRGGAVHEVASTGTVTVYDRRGRRLGTVYLARVPEPGQVALGAQLTALLKELLRRWAGPLPRLCYVTDAGDNETAYYKEVLRRLRHPVTGRRLAWVWVVDYYHAAERLGTMAEAVFGAGQRAWAWVRKMRKLLLKPGGLYRVLHSAAALRARRQLSGKRRADFRRAYNYLRGRGRQLRYAAFRRLGLPIGSGVTEAACKTVFAQRLKLSGMRWHKAGAQVVLALRVLLLSGVWDQAYAHTLQPQSTVEVRTPSPGGEAGAEFAA